MPQHAAAVAASGLAAGPADWGSKGSPLRALHHAPKLQALAELLQVLPGISRSHSRTTSSMLGCVMLICWPKASTQ